MGTVRLFTEREKPAAFLKGAIVVETLLFLEAQFLFLTAGIKGGSTPGRQRGRRQLIIFISPPFVKAEGNT